MESKYIESQRGKVYYEIEKNIDKKAVCIFFLPGLSADHRLFCFQIPYFTSKYTVLTWDAPAHGKSRPYKDFSYSNSADELKKILDKEEIERVVLVGQSAGGFVAQSFVAKYPDMTSGILTIGSSPYGTKYYSKSDIFWLRQTKWMFKPFPDRLLRQMIAKACCTTERGRENMLSILSCYTKKELCHLLYLGFAGFITEIRDIEIPCPVSLTFGEKDKTGKVRKYNMCWHSNENYPLHIIKGAAHNANADRPEEMNHIIDEFIESISMSSKKTDINKTFA